MKKSIVKKSLRLSTETVRSLTVGQLDAVVGGIVAPSRGTALSCGTRACNTAPPQ